ncbi:MAG TPA: hypothetical protein VJT15_13545 [Pyrinomonadaceae bacterium]|nr:hypothetical protein [Pyrinomonadaceae bacterium]
MVDGLLKSRLVGPISAARAIVQGSQRLLVAVLLALIVSTQFAQSAGYVCPAQQAGTARHDDAPARFLCCLERLRQ